MASAGIYVPPCSPQAADVDVRPLLRALMSSRRVKLAPTTFIIVSNGFVLIGGRSFSPVWLASGRGTNGLDHASIPARVFSLFPEKLLHGRASRLQCHQIERHLGSRS